jgi:hypothetical protein
MPVGCYTRSAHASELLWFQLRLRRSVWAGMGARSEPMEGGPRLGGLQRLRGPRVQPAGTEAGTRVLLAQGCNGGYTWTAYKRPSDRVTHPAPPEQKCNAMQCSHVFAGMEHATVIVV